MHHAIDDQYELTGIRTTLAALHFELTLIRLSHLLRKANFNPGQARNERAQAQMRDTYGVGVIIVHDPRTRNGFRVLTAYPRNEE